MDLDELTFGTFGDDVLYLYDSENVIRLKECTKCGRVRSADLYGTASSNFSGLKSHCHDCLAAKRREQYTKNPNHYNSITKKWAAGNPEKMKLLQQRASALRKARLACLPATLTQRDILDMFDHFEWQCALSSESEGLHIDHAVPVASGHGGSIVENIIPLRGDLNMSKSDRNIFEWYDANHERFNLSQQRFNRAIAYLANLNEMTPQEYRAYVDWCHVNPKVVELV